MSHDIGTTVRGAPRTRASVVRLRDVLADLVGRRRARMVIEHLIAVDLLPQGERRFSAPVTPRQAAVALVTAAADAGIAADALGRAMAIGGSFRHEPGKPPGPCVLDALTAEIERCLVDPNFEPSEWHLALAATKALHCGGDGDFDLYLPEVAEPAARRLRLPFERVDVLPGYALREAAELWR